MQDAAGPIWSNLGLIVLPNDTNGAGFEERNSPYFNHLECRFLLQVLTTNVINETRERLMTLATKAQMTLGKATTRPGNYILSHPLVTYGLEWRTEA